MDQQYEIHQSTWSQLISSVKASNPLLYKITLIHVLLGIISMVGLLIDDRLLLGVSVWLKPLKFCISSAIYIFTVAYLLQLYPYTKRKVNIYSRLIGWTLLFEILIIVIQGARGVSSHYNIYSPLDGILFSLMGIFIGVNVVFMAVLAFDALRLKLQTKPSIRWAIFLGWIVILVGSWVGGQMISQMSHSVGVADGGEGLPLVNWSTKGGDIRIAHFLGIHGLQAIPLFAWFVGRKWKASQRNQIIAVTLFALMYAAVMGLLFYQAKQGMPLLEL